MDKFQKYANKNHYEGLFVEGDYKKKFERTVSRLLKLFDENGSPPPLEIRKNIIEALCDAYIEQVEERPDGVQIQRLANWLLYEELTDSRPDKVTLTEYPVLTKRQLKTRYNREQANENIPYILTEQRYLGRKKSHEKID